MCRRQHVALVVMPCHSSIARNLQGRRVWRRGRRAKRDNGEIGTRRKAAGDKLILAAREDNGLHWVRERSDEGETWIVARGEGETG